MKTIKVIAGSLCYRTACLFSLLLLFLFTTSCNGQVKSNLPDEARTITSGQSKLIKTQGSDQYQNVHCGLQDKAGNMWFGTTGEGVYRYDGKSFTQFTEKDGLSSNTVWSILEDKLGNIWIGTKSGLCCYNPKQAVGNAITRILIAVTKSSNLFLPALVNNASSAKNEVFSIMQDKSGTLWFGTTEGVYGYDGKSFTRFLDDKSIVNSGGLRLESVQCMLEDKNGTIWFGSGPMAFEGVCRYDSKQAVGKSITGFKPNGEGWLRKMTEDKNGTIWLANRHHGISCYEPGKADGTIFTKFAEKEEFSKTGTGAILQDKAGNIWFASLGKDDDGGIWRYDPSASLKAGSKSFKNFTTKDGLPHNSVFCIVEDRSGNIWVGSRNNGLCRYDPKRTDGKSFTSFSENAPKQ